MKKFISVLSLAGLLLASPAFAAEGIGADKPMSILQFAAAPEQTGLNVKVVIKKYEVYRRALALAPEMTLGKAALRSNEIRHRA
ncbi:MAG: hypothetical protein HYZ52_03670 [Candidatus Omnitrophica bacterium]|nr:hypothetical protein [Candidatus Omnitrophota bacterium]